MEFTGSSYDGDTIHGRMEGDDCCYQFPPTISTKYVGEMKDGMFHGNGTLYFSNGSKYTGEWRLGKAIKGSYVLKDGLHYTPDNWTYCNTTDRRFFTEAQHGLSPAGRSQVTNSPIPPSIAENAYDCGDGSYDPVQRQVSDYKTGQFVRNTDQEEHNWIIGKCRKGWDEHVGYRAEDANISNT